MEDKEHMKSILKYIDCWIILNNLLVEKDVIEQEKKWMDEDDFSDIDDDARAPRAIDLLNMTLRQGCLKDERRSKLSTKDILSTRNNFQSNLNSINNFNSINNLIYMFYLVLNCTISGK